MAYNPEINQPQATPYAVAKDTINTAIEQDLPDAPYVKYDNGAFYVRLGQKNSDLLSILEESATSGWDRAITIYQEEDITVEQYPDRRYVVVRKYILFSDGRAVSEKSSDGPSAAKKKLEYEDMSATDLKRMAANLATARIMHSN